MKKTKQTKVNTIHAEASIIGSLIGDPRLFARCNKVLKPEMFHYYADIYSWMIEMEVDKMLSWDIQLVVSKYGDITDLIVAAQPETIDSAISFLKEEYDKSRDALIYWDAIRQLEIDSPYNVREYVSTQLGEDSTVEQEKSRGQEMHEAWRDIEEGEIGTKTVWDEFNRIAGGAQRGHTGFIAGTTGTGKTEKAIEFGLHLAKTGKPFAFFSIELTKRQVWQRAYSIESGLSMEVLSRRRYDQVKQKYVLDLSAEDSKKLSDAMMRIANAPFYVIDARECTNKATLLRQKIRWYIRNHDLFGYALDYIQLCETGIDKVDNSGNETKVLSKFAKDMMTFNKTANVLGIWLSQLNRGIIARSDRRPRNSDLMATSALENAADWIVLLFRPGAYEDWKVDATVDGKIVSRYNYNGTQYDQYDCEYILSKNRAFGGRNGSWWKWQSDTAQPASNQFPVKEQPHAAPLQEPAQADSRDFERELLF